MVNERYCTKGENNIFLCSQLRLLKVLTDHSLLHIYHKIEGWLGKAHCTFPSLRWSQYEHLDFLHTGWSLQTQKFEVHFSSGSICRKFKDTRSFHVLWHLLYTLKLSSCSNSMFELIKLTYLLKLSAYLPSEKKQEDTNYKSFSHLVNAPLKQVDLFVRSPLKCKCIGDLRLGSYKWSVSSARSTAHKVLQNHRIGQGRKDCSGSSGPFYPAQVGSF